MGWLWWLSRVAAFAANLGLMVSYSALLIPALDDVLWRNVAIVAVVLTLLAVNIAGVRDSTLASTIFTVAKLAALLLFIGAGLFHLDGDRFRFAEVPDSANFGTAVLLLIYAFTGFEMVTVPAGEARNPRRDLPQALLIAISAVIVVYLGIQMVCIGTLPSLAQSTRPLADAASRFAGPLGGTAIAAGAMISIIGNLNLLVLASSRIPFAMACRGELPAWIATVHPQRQTPHWAIILTAAVMLTLALSRTFLAALTISSASRLAAYGATAVALLRLRKKADAPAARFHLPFAGGLVALTLALTVWLLFHTSRAEAIQTAVITAVGIALYAGTRWLTVRRQ